MAKGNCRTSKSDVTGCHHTIYGKEISKIVKYWTVPKSIRFILILFSCWITSSKITETFRVCTARGWHATWTHQIFASIISDLYPSKDVLYSVGSGTITMAKFLRACDPVWQPQPPKPIIFSSDLHWSQGSSTIFMNTIAFTNCSNLTIAEWKNLC